MLSRKFQGVEAEVTTRMPSRQDVTLTRFKENGI